MGRKEKRKQQQIKKKENRLQSQILSLKQQKQKNLLISRNAMLISIAATLLAVKDEKGLSKKMTIRVMDRINSILQEFNSGSQGRLNEILEVVRDELDFDLKEI